MKNNYMICMMAILSLYNIEINAVESQSDDGKKIVKKNGIEQELKEVDLAEKTDALSNFIANKTDAELLIIERLLNQERKKRSDDAFRSKNMEASEIIKSLEILREKNPELNLYLKIDKKINLIKDLMVMKDMDLHESYADLLMSDLDKQIDLRRDDLNSNELDITDFIKYNYTLFKSFAAGNTNIAGLINAIDKILDRSYK